MSQEVECARNIATEIVRQSKTLNLKVNVAIAANVDVAIHAARLIKGRHNNFTRRRAAHNSRFLN
jgi:hypothetical protein